MAARWFYGWNVVAAVFVMAMLSFGLGFYGVTVYVATLQRLHDWSAAAVSAPITVYYVTGALVLLYPVFLTMSLGRRRGLAVSLVFNGATLGGVVIVPALLWLIGRVGFARARGWSPVLASNRGLGPLHLIAGAQDR